MDIPPVLSNYYKGQEWTLNGDNYEGLIWYDERNTLPKPTLEELTEKWNELTAARPLKELRTKRNRVLEQTDRYTVADFPYATESDKQARLTQRRALRDLPSLVTPLEGGLMNVWVTDENGPLQAGDGLILSSNITGYFTKGEPAVVTIRDACDFSDTHYYSNIASVTYSNVITTSETAQEGYTENAYWTSNIISHYEGNVVSYYTNVVVYDGVSVYTNVDTEAYSNLDAVQRALYTPVEVVEKSLEPREGFEPVLTYSNVSFDQYDANVHTEYTKVITHYSNVSTIETIKYSNISVSEYEKLDMYHVITPGYTDFFNETSNTAIRVQQYTAMTPEQRSEYMVRTFPTITMNLKTYYTPIARDIKDINGHKTTLVECTL